MLENHLNVQWWGQARGVWYTGRGAWCAPQCRSPVTSTLSQAAAFDAFDNYLSFNENKVQERTPSTSMGSLSMGVPCALSLAAHAPRWRTLANQMLPAPLGLVQPTNFAGQPIYLARLN